MSEQTTALWARINEINCELEALSASAAAGIVSGAGRIPGERLGAWISRESERHCVEHRVREERAATLRLELAELRAKLPPEGVRSGQRLVLYKGLGEVILREDREPEYAEVHAPVDEWD